MRTHTGPFLIAAWGLCAPASDALHQAAGLLQIRAVPGVGRLCPGTGRGTAGGRSAPLPLPGLLAAALSGLTADEVKNVVIAYEPVWAIGTGLTATDEQANETIGVIREAVRAAYGDAADDVRIQYGGSMNPKNCKGLMAQPEIDGGLIGGASLKAEDFSKVVHFDA